MIHGEAVVMRLLRQDAGLMRLDDLGMGEREVQLFRQVLEMPHGIVLVTGPTGSGKTTTLYSALNEINDPGKCIRTAEDPIEYTLNGLLQMQMHRQIGLTFAKALRSFLRQDPDIILVGEIRDQETAQIAVEAALTGHMLFSTLHTNDAPSTVNRLMNMGIEPFLVATSVHLICAQRLVRRLCSNCKEAVSAPPQALIDIGFTAEEAPKVQLFKGRGCDNCSNSGYKGRVGLYEVFEVSDGVKELILVGATSLELKRKAQEEGMLTLRGSGLQKLREGVTTVEEIVRETVA